ncbi:MAG TPA: hypothetical protein VK638_12115 [Edaphobacter sp.]|nr:hypothetical protein [Edaphobacter sp.]
MCPFDPALLAPPYKRFRVSRALADDYIELFLNRREYSIQATKPMMNGKIGWYLARQYKTKEPKQLDNATVRAHIDGDFTINLYSTNPESQRCKWVAIDADYDGSMKDLLQLRYELKQDSIQAALEQRSALVFRFRAAVCGRASRSFPNKTWWKGWTSAMPCEDRSAFIAGSDAAIGSSRRNKRPSAKWRT